MRTFLLAALILLVVTPAFAASPGTDESAARELFQRLNQARAQRGLPALQWDDRLAAAAAAHAQLMAEHHKLSHDFSGEPPLMQRLASTGLHLDRSGENVAYDANAEGAHQGLMASPPHRANILNDSYNAVGIAAVPSGNMLYVVEDFARVMAQTSDANALNTIKAKFAELRRKAGSPPIPEKPDARVQSLACSMGQRDALVTQAGLALPNARYAVAYTAMRPGLSTDVAKFRDVQGIEHYSVGVCFARTPQYPGGTYWILLVLFAPPRTPHHTSR